MDHFVIAYFHLYLFILLYSGISVHIVNQPVLRNDNIVKLWNKSFTRYSALSDIIFQLWEEISFPKTNLFIY